MVIWKAGLLKGLQTVVHDNGAPCCHAGDLFLSVYGDGLFNLCKGLQSHPAPKSNQSDSGQVRLLKPSSTHTIQFYFLLTDRQRQCLTLDVIHPVLSTASGGHPEFIER